MTSLLTAYLLVLLIPLFVASWRTSISGLAAQGLLMAWMLASRHPSPSASLAVTLIDVGLLRGIVVPLAMYRVVRAQNRPARNDVIPPNMLSWALIAGVIALGFRASGWLAPGGGPEHIRVAVAATAAMLGLFVLATQNGVFSQSVGALRLENSIALFELGVAAHAPLGLQIAQVVVYLGTALAYVVFVRRLYPAAPAESATRRVL